MGRVGHAGCVERVCSKRAEAELSVWRVALWMWCRGGTTYRRVSRANDWGTTRWNAGRLIARASWGSRATRRESTSRVSFDRRRHATRTHLQQAGTTGNTNSVSEEPNGTEHIPVGHIWSSRPWHMADETEWTLLTRRLGLGRHPREGLLAHLRAQGSSSPLAQPLPMRRHGVHGSRSYSAVPSVMHR